jgi:hypothetical protein
VSACLAGINCRWDGTSKPCKKIINLIKQGKAIPICPEQLGGFATPRDSAELHGNKVVTKTGEDITAQIRKGAKGATIINHARGEGPKHHKSFFGLEIDSHRDVVMVIVEEHLSRNVLNAIAKTGKFDNDDNAGIAFQVDVENIVGVSEQVKLIQKDLEDKLIDLKH